MGPHAAHCVSSLPPEGAQAPFGRPDGCLVPPHAPHCVSSLPPGGAQAPFGRPGGRP